VLLNQGQRFTVIGAGDATAEDLRGWIGRLAAIGRTLAEHLEAPARAAVLELLEHSGLDVRHCALIVLRINIAGASPNELAAEVGVAGGTIRNLEDRGASCNPSTAKKLSDRFGLRVLELFVQRGDDLVPRTVGELRRVLADGS
jgi:DNA-binding XRE family transcriptional regulator